MSRDLSLSELSEMAQDVYTSTPNINGDGFEEKSFWATCGEDGKVAWGKGEKIGSQQLQDMALEHRFSPRFTLDFAGCLL